MQLLVFAGEDYYPNEYFGDYRGLLPSDRTRWQEPLPSAAELAAYLSTLDEPTWPGQASLERCSWVAVLAVDGQSPPQRQCWDLLHASSSGMSPTEQLARKGCTAWWKLATGWAGIRLNDGISASLMP